MRIDEDPPLIIPRRGRREEPLPKAAVLVFTSQDLSLFTHCLSEYPEPVRKLFLADVFVGTYEGVSMAVAGPMLGAPQSVMVLEKLIALGAETVVSVGWCGSLRSTVVVGDVVLPMGAVSEEGTSAHYPGKKRGGPSDRLVGALKEAFQGEGLKVHEGEVWTTDAPFRETAAKVLKHQGSGILAVDMETSALFAVAGFRGIDLASVLVVSDELFTLKWKHGFREPGFRRTRELMIVPILRSVSSIQPSAAP